MGNTMFNLIFRLGLCVVLISVSLEVQAGLPEALVAYKAKNFKVALKELLPLAENSDAVALFYIALMYENAEGLPQNFAQAMTLYRRSADSGYAPAQCNLGYMYETEAGADRSYKDAAFWYRKAANQGNAAAQYNLGLMYYIGRGTEVPRNYKEAAAWQLKAAEQGHVFAQNSLGKMYENGQGVLVSLVQADMWYILASTSGNESAKVSKQSLEAKMDPELLQQAQSLALEWRENHKGLTQVNR
jgi:TPR repeat protein